MNLFCHRKLERLQLLSVRLLKRTHGQMIDSPTPQSKWLVCFYLWHLSFMRERGRRASGEPIMEDERRHDGGGGTDSQVGMFTFLPQLVDSVAFKRRFYTCCLWRMWFILSVTQSRSSLCHVVTSSEEMNSPRPPTGHSLRWWMLSSLV